MDDDINEVEQLFVIFLRVVDAVNPDRVDLTGRFATLGRIIDDDRKCGNGVLFALYESIEKNSCS